MWDTLFDNAFWIILLIGIAISIWHGFFAPLSGLDLLGDTDKDRW